MSEQSETIGGASNEKGTQYEDISAIAESIDFCNSLSDQIGGVTSVSSARSETIGGDCGDKQTQYEEYSYDNFCNSVLETIEEEVSEHTPRSEEYRTGEFPKAAETARQDRGEWNPCLEFDETELHNNLKCLASDGFDTARLEIFDTSAPNEYSDLTTEDAGCIIDKLDPIEELTEVDSLDSFSMHESELSREEEILREETFRGQGVVSESHSEEQISEIPQDNGQADMEVDTAVAAIVAETRLPPEGAKMDSETHNQETEDTHSVDSLEMIESEKPPWKESESPTTGSPHVPQENNFRKNEHEEDEKNADSISQSGSSVADSLDSDPTLINGARRSQSSTSEDGASTPNKKDSRLPIFVDKHPKFKGSNIPKPKTIRPKPGQSVQQAKKAHEAPAKVEEHSNHDETLEKAKLRRTASLSPVQRRKNSNAEKEVRKVPTNRPRQHSHDLGDTKPSIEPRETLASRRRQEAIEKGSIADLKEGSDEYLTPLQRKEHHIKELRQEMKDLQKVLAERESELKIFHTEKQRDLELLTKEKDDVIKGLEANNERLQESFNELQTSHEEVLRLANDLELKLHDLKEEMTHREARHQEMYLEMYNKGKDSARFERLDELEKIAKEEPDKVTVAELLEKLKTTETELGYWQSLKRHDIYAETEKPETEAAATLRFLKDSMYHYITDPKDSHQHFLAMIRIFGYTAVQMKNIDKALLQDKKTKNLVTKSKPPERKSSK